MSGTRNTRSDNSTLDINDFFTLLTAQLKNQNMYNTVDDTQFISQMAQFTTLQQMNELTRSFQSTYAVSLVGKDVTASYEDLSGAAKLITGTVESLVFNNGTPLLKIGDIYVETNNVREVKNAASSQTDGGAADIGEQAG